MKICKKAAREMLAKRNPCREKKKKKYIPLQYRDVILLFKYIRSSSSSCNVIISRLSVYFQRGIFFPTNFYNGNSFKLTFVSLWNGIKWGAFYLFIAKFFATQIIGGAMELVVLL